MKRHGAGVSLRDSGPLSVSELARWRPPAGPGIPVGPTRVLAALDVWHFAGLAGAGAGERGLCRIVRYRYSGLASIRLVWVFWARHVHLPSGDWPMVRPDISARPVLPVVSCLACPDLLEPSPPSPVRRPATAMGLVQMTHFFSRP